MTEEWHEQRILQSRIYSQYKNSSSSIWLTPAPIILALSFSWGLLPQSIVIFWGIAIMSVVIWRFMAIRKFLSENPALPVRRTGFWIKMEIMSSILFGISWGALSLLIMYVDGLHWQILVVVVIVGINATTVPLLSSYVYSYYALSVASFVPMMATMIIEGSPEMLYGAFAAFIFFVLLVQYARRLDKVEEQGYRLKLNNEELIQDLKEKNLQIERAGKAKTRFLAAASHDLRQPMYALNLFLDGLPAYVNDREGRNLLEKVESSVDSMSRLLDAMLDISRFDADVVNVQFQSVHVTSLVSKLLLDYELLAQNKGLMLDIESINRCVFADETLLYQILNNLFSNAIRYTPQGNVGLRIVERGENLEFSVWDTGIGIDAGEHDRIFEEFYQAGDLERDRSKGLGLGLAIVSRASRLLKTRVNLESERGVGSAFSFLLPICDCVEQSTEYRDVTTIGANNTENGSLCFLVVDNEQEIIDGTRMMLENWGCRVHTAANMNEAIEQVKALDCRIDFIITDYQLEEKGNGLDLIYAVERHCKSKITSLIISGDTTPELLQDIKNAGYSLLHKPIAPAKLRSIIQYKLRSVNEIESSASTQ